MRDYPVYLNFPGWIKNDTIEWPVRCYIQCTHPLLARLLDVIKCSITFMLTTLCYTLHSGRRLFLIGI